jgi:hypothetical protein
MRPTFYLCEDYDKKYPIRAGGVLFYFKDEFLMIHSRGKYEDFGGQTDIGDNDLVDTVCREVEEESNGIFSKEYVKEKIKDIEPIYIKHCKYMLYIVELDKHYDPEIFGNKEIYDGLDRTIEWISWSEYKDKPLNFRLTDRNVYSCLNKFCFA